MLLEYFSVRDISMAYNVNNANVSLIIVSNTLSYQWATDFNDAHVHVFRQFRVEK